MQYILLILCLIQLAAIVWLVMQVQKLRRPQDDTALRTLRQEIAADTQNQMQMLGNLLSENQRQSGDYQAERLEQMERGMDARLRQFESRVGNLERSNAQGMEQIRSAVAANLHRMQTQQQDSLAEIQSTVNEKLAQSLNQKIGQSFQLVSSRLEQVYQGLGEMQTLAVGVGDLKKVLSNVKTRGILGEVQLGAILQEILAPEQYATEIPTLPNSRNHVEFAVRMPADGEQPVWLPIDSKFPGDTYAALQDAREQGDPAQVEAARQKLLSVVRSCAKDIRDKYVQPPYTTNFGILFLPFEGLYAEVVNSGPAPAGVQHQRCRTVHHGGDSERTANGIPHPCHPETQPRGVGGAGCSPQRVRKVRRNDRKGAEKSPGRRAAAGTSGRDTHPCHCAPAPGSGTASAGGTAPGK